LATAYGNIAEVYSSGLKQPGKALDAAREEYRIIEKLVADHPGVYSFKSDQAFSSRGMARRLKDLGRRPEALEFYGKAREIWEGLLRDFHTVYIYQRSLAEINLDLADLDPPNRDSHLFQAVCGYSQGIDLIGFKKTKDQLTPEETATREKQGDRALELLRKMREHGYFQDPAKVEDVTQNRKLDPLRKREDFQTLLADLKEKANSRAKNGDR
jgi:hypothetical protein